MSDEPGAILASGHPVSPPAATVHTAGGDARWATLVGRLDSRSDGTALRLGDAGVAIDRRCTAEPMPRPQMVSVTGILVGKPERLIVPCGGMKAAPTLHRSATRAAIEPAALTDRVGSNGTDAQPEPLPSVLLLLAAGALAAGAAAARRLSPDGMPGPASGEVGPEADDESTSPPALTLVPMPRERAP
jgi:hypothetical protein